MKNSQKLKRMAKLYSLANKSLESADRASADAAEVIGSIKAGGLSPDEIVLRINQAGHLAEKAEKAEKAARLAMKKLDRISIRI